MHHQGAELNALELEHGVDLRKKSVGCGAQSVRAGAGSKP